MTEAADLTIRSAMPDELSRIEPLWIALYEYQKAKGMLLELPVDAYQKWMDSIRPVMGRFACVFLAESYGDGIGFLAARIRAIPPWFGAGQTGFISDVYVDDRHQSKRVGEQLLVRAAEWFREQGIDRIELQVIANNTRARKFYARHGWREELVQMVWQETH